MKPARQRRITDTVAAQGLRAEVDASTAADTGEAKARGARRRAPRAKGQGQGATTDAGVGVDTAPVARTARLKLPPGSAPARDETALSARHGTPTLNLAPPPAPAGTPSPLASVAEPKPVAFGRSAPPAARITVLTLFAAAVLTTGLLAAYASSLGGGAAANWRTVVAVQSTERRSDLGAITSAPFWSTSSVRIVLEAPAGVSLAALQVTIVPLDKAGTAGADVPRPVSAAAGAVEASVMGLNGLYALRASAPGPDTWSLYVLTSR